jgi:hypothetical protein
MYRMILGLIHLGLIRKRYKSFIENAFLGLGGLGTNNLRTAKEREDFGEALLVAIQKTTRASVNENMAEINGNELNFEGKPLDKCISEWMRNVESTGNMTDINLVRIVEMVKSKYGTEAAAMESVLTNFNATEFLNDINKVAALCGTIENAKILELKHVILDLKIVLAAYDAYKISVLNALTKK